MFEGRALSELTYAEFEQFLKEANEEGTRLDYKQQWDPARAAQVVSSFANSAGGLLVVGVEEKRDPKNTKIKLKIPDPINVPGLEPRSPRNGRPQPRARYARVPAPAWYRKPRRWRYLIILAATWSCSCGSRRAWRPLTRCTPRPRPRYWCGGETTQRVPA
jgi:hypothetical protein